MREGKSKRNQKQNTKMQKKKKQKENHLKNKQQAATSIRYTNTF